MKLVVALNGSDEAVDPGFGELGFSFLEKQQDLICCGHY
jgi:hypothetical protein